MIIETQNDASSTTEGQTTSISSAPQNPGRDEEKKDTVLYETHAKLLSQRKNDLAKMKEMQERLELLEQEKKQVQEQELAKQGEYKKLLELREEELAKEKNRASQASKQLEDTWKLQAVYEKLPGKIKRSEYLNFIDLESIAFNPETNELDSSSVEKVVNDFVQNHADLIQYNGKKLPANAPAQNGFLSYTDEIKTARNQKEFDAIRLKHGRI